MKKKMNLRTLLIIFMMGFAYAVMYALTFIQYVFYEPLVEALGSTNAQLGVLIMIFGFGNIFGAPFGGLLSDRFNAKKIYLASLVANALLCFFFAFNMNYKVALFVWAGLAIAGLFALFPAHIKLIRLLGDDTNQGTMFGFAESAAGIGSVIVNFIALFLFNKFMVQGGVVGIKAAIIGYGVLSLIITVILWKVLPDPEKSQSQASEDDTIRLRDFGEVLKYPGTWLSGIAIFTTYTLYVSLSYFTPYFTDVLKVAVVFTGGIAIIRTYLTRFIGAPFGGWLGDKVGSVTKVMGTSLLMAFIIILVFTKLPVGTSLAVLISLTMLLAVFAYMARGTMFAVTTETKCPRRVAATTAGVTCAIGYSPDLFQFTLFGNWIDKYGNAGYDYIFIYTLVVMAIGVANAVAILLYKKHLKKKNGIVGKEA